ncbi:MAG: 3-oxoacyl-ACP reductase FabG [Pseudomonadota bacterium]
MTASPVIVLVTGASRGIGQTIAHALAQPDRFVIGTATTEAGAAVITDQFANAGLAGQGICLDVADQASVDAAVKHIRDTHGPIQILVNNAGITRDNLLMRMSPEDWDTVLNTNLSSLYRLSRACLRPMMKLKTGRIINIASIVGSSGNPGQANYAAAKAGMLGFTRSLAREVASRGITVNAVAPGFIDTDMTRALPDEQRDNLLATIPLARLGAPEEIAATVAFLASKAAGYITGETIHVNGGMYMH